MSPSPRPTTKKPPFATRPGILSRAVFNQSTYWADRTGAMHKLSDMSRSHLQNVLRMLEGRADELWADFRRVDIDRRAAKARLKGTGFLNIDSSWVADVDNPPTTITGDEWLASTKLVLRIKRLLAAPAVTR